MEKNANANLGAAKTAKKDEFYTQLTDILKKNFLRSGNPFGKKCSGHRATVC